MASGRRWRWTVSLQTVCAATSQTCRLWRRSLVRPDVIINAAAHTAVDKAQAEPELALRLNAEAPEVMAQA